MRIRKGRLARGNVRASLAMASPPHLIDISQQLEIVSSSRGLDQKIHESGAVEQRQSLSAAEGSLEKAPLALLERLQISSTGMLIPPNSPYMNLDEFVNSLARTNCFPADEESDDPHNNVVRQSSCSLTNSSVQTGEDEESTEFGRSFGAMSPCSAQALHCAVATVETSLRLGTPSSISANLQYRAANCRSTTSEIATGAAAADRAEQTAKSSAGYIEQRSGRQTRVSTSPGSKRGHFSPSLAAWYYCEQPDAQEDTNSEFSVQQAQSSRQAPTPPARQPSSRVSVSSSTLPTSPERHPNQMLAKPVAKRTMKRSGRPKKLKYLQQGNVEELGNQCNRRDGKGWTCPLLAKPGYQLCDHHLDKLRCKPGSRAKYSKSTKKTRKRNQVKNEA